MLSVIKAQTEQQRMRVHAFVIMPDHLHLLITPDDAVSIEKAVQFIKGGFSFRLKRELKHSGLVWQESFAQHRVQGRLDFLQLARYISENPVRAKLVERAEEYRFSSAFRG